MDLGSFLIGGGLCNAALVLGVCVCACVGLITLRSRGAFRKHGTNSQARPSISKQENFPVEVLESAGL